MNEQGKVPGIPNSELFEAMAHSKRDAADNAVDRMQEIELNQGVVDAGFQLIVERTREVLQEQHPDIEFPAVKDGEGVIEYVLRAFADLRGIKAQDES